MIDLDLIFVVLIHRLNLIEMTIENAIELVKTTNAILVWGWSECPFDEKYELGHGGDEDWVIIQTTNTSFDYVVDRLTVCDNNRKEIANGIEMVVTAHA